MEPQTPRPLLDLVGTGELARALRERGDRGWEPEAAPDAAGRRRASLKPALKILPWLMLPLGLLAVAGLVAALRAIAGGDSPGGAAGWLRFGLLVVGVVFIGSQMWRLISKTRPARRLRSRFERPKPRAAVPLLDAAPLGALRSAAPEGWGEPGRRAVAGARARRLGGSTSWWALVVLALLLSAGIVVAMVAIAGWELARGREPGPWLVLPLFAAAFAALGFGMSLRTALRSREDLRQRRRLRLFRRVLGYIARGPGGGHVGAGQGASLPSNMAGAAGSRVAAFGPNTAGAVGHAPGAMAMAIGSVAVPAAGAIGGVPGRLMNLGERPAPVGGLGLAGFAVASVALAWAGFGWPTTDADAGGGAPGPELAGAFEAGPADEPTVAPETPAPGPQADLPLAAPETPSPTPETPEPSPTGDTPAGAAGGFTAGSNPPAGATPSGGGFSAGAPTATHTPTPTATPTPSPTATPTRTPTAAPDVDPPPPPPDEPTDPREPREPREPSPSPTTPTFGVKTPDPVFTIKTPTPTVGSSIPIVTPTPTQGGFTIGNQPN